MSPTGKLIVERLSKIGHRVYFGIQPSQTAVRTIPSMATAMPLDLADDNSVSLAATGLLKAERRIDVIVNNQRDPLFGALEMVNPEEAEAYLNATLIGMVRLQTAFLPIECGPYSNNCAENRCRQFIALWLEKRCSCGRIRPC